MVLKEYNFVPPRRAIQPANVLRPTSSISNGMVSAPGQVNTLTVRRRPKQKRRIELGSNTSNNSQSAFSAPIQSAGSTLARMDRSEMMAARHGAFTNQSAFGNADAGPSRGTKRMAVDMGDMINQGRVAVGVASSVGSSGMTLRVPPTQTQLEVVSGQNRLQISNADKHQVTAYRGSEKQWEDYLPSSIVSIATSDRYSAISSEDGWLVVYSAAGRRWVSRESRARVMLTYRLSTLKLDLPAVHTVFGENHLGVITAACGLLVL